jgi:phage head maturation protease
VSIGFDPILSKPVGDSDVQHHQIARLNEVSIVDRGAYEGEGRVKIEIPRRRCTTATAAPVQRTLVRPSIGQVLAVR